MRILIAEAETTIRPGPRTAGGARRCARRGRVARRRARGAEGDRACQGPADGEGGPLRRRCIRAPAQGEPGLRPAAESDRGGRDRYARSDMSSTLTPPKERTRRGTGSGVGDARRVIVLNDNHNTFEGGAFALAPTIPGVDSNRGMAPAKRIPHTRQAN